MCAHIPGFLQPCTPHAALASWEPQIQPSVLRPCKGAAAVCVCVCACGCVCACAPIYLLVRLKRKRRLPLSILNDAKRVMLHPSKAWLTVDKQQFQKLYSLCVVFLCGLLLKYFQGNNVSVFIRGRSRISTCFFVFFPLLHFTGLNNNVLRFNQA